jgi:hypothetical protein
MNDDFSDEDLEGEEPLDGYFDDDGNRLNPDLVPKPALCLLCRHDDDPNQLIECNLNRLDQDGEKDFKCAAYKPKSGAKIP